MRRHVVLSRFSVFFILSLSFLFSATTQGKSLSIVDVGGWGSGTYETVAQLDDKVYAHHVRGLVDVLSSVPEQQHGLVTGLDFERDINEIMAFQDYLVIHFIDSTLAFYPLRELDAVVAEGDDNGVVKVNVQPIFTMIVESTVPEFLFSGDDIFILSDERLFWYTHSNGSFQLKADHTVLNNIADSAYVDIPLAYMDADLVLVGQTLTLGRLMHSFRLNESVLRSESWAITPAGLSRSGDTDETLVASVGQDVHMLSENSFVVFESNGSLRFFEKDTDFSLVNRVEIDAFGRFVTTELLDDKLWVFSQGLNIKVFDVSQPGQVVFQANQDIAYDYPASWGGTRISKAPGSSVFVSHRTGMEKFTLSDNQIISGQTFYTQSGPSGRPVWDHPILYVPRGARTDELLVSDPRNPLLVQQSYGTRAFQFSRDLYTVDNQSDGSFSITSVVEASNNLLTDNFMFYEPLLTNNGDIIRVARRNQTEGGARQEIGIDLPRFSRSGHLDLYAVGRHFVAGRQGEMIVVVDGNSDTIKGFAQQSISSLGVSCAGVKAYFYCVESDLRGENINMLAFTIDESGIFQPIENFEQPEAFSLRRQFDFLAIDDKLFMLSYAGQSLRYVNVFDVAQDGQLHFLGETTLEGRNKLTKTGKYANVNGYWYEIPLYSGRMNIFQFNYAPNLPVLDTIVFQEDTSWNQALPERDSEDDPLTYSIEIQPDNGEVDISDENTVVYTPSPDFNGEDSVTLIAFDPLGNSSEMTINYLVTPVNDAPQSSLETVVVSVFSGRSINIDLSFTDAEGDSFSVELSAPPTLGTASLSASGMLSYTANENATGADSLTVTATDASGASSSVVIDISVKEPDGGGGALSFGVLVLWLLWVTRYVAVGHVNTVPRQL